MALVAGVGLGSALVPVARSGAHSINMSWHTVANTGAMCVQLRAEIDHDTDQVHRYYWTLRSMTEHSTGTDCTTLQNGYLRLKGESYMATSGGTLYGLCSATIGDGLGVGGYYHSTEDVWGLNSYWWQSGECGAGDYKAKTYGHRQNNGWFGGEIVSGLHAFK
jgi:hypothetical protein